MSEAKIVLKFGHCSTLSSHAYLAILDHTQPNQEMREIQVGIQDLVCLRTKVIDAHSHGIYKEHEVCGTSLCSNTCGGLRSANFEKHIFSWVLIFIHGMSFS